MYCIECGMQNPDHTRYCSRCGVNLETLRRAATGHLLPPVTSPLNSRHVGLILTLSALLGFGSLLILFACIVAVASASMVERNQLAPVAVVLGALATGGSVFVISRLLKMISQAGPARVDEPAVAPRAIPAPPVSEPLPQSVRPERVPSVVEHTTHNLPQYVPPRDPES